MNSHNPTALLDVEGAETALPANVAAGAMQHMNADHAAALLGYARALAGCHWADAAEMVALDATGFTLRVRGAGREETTRLPFPTPVQDATALRAALVAMAQETGSAGDPRVATARVATPNAARYLKALCNHFDRKGTASYDGTRGSVAFPFGTCGMEAQADALLLRAEAESETMLARVKAVVGDHLVRFGVNEALQVSWAGA